jgi:hypothetical protein
MRDPKDCTARTGCPLGCPAGVCADQLPAASPDTLAQRLSNWGEAKQLPDLPVDTADDDALMAAVSGTFPVGLEDKLRNILFRHGSSHAFSIATALMPVITEAYGALLMTLPGPDTAPTDGRPPALLWVQWGRGGCPERIATVKPSDAQGWDALASVQAIADHMRHITEECAEWREIAKGLRARLGDGDAALPR